MREQLPNIIIQINGDFNHVQVIGNENECRSESKKSRTASKLKKVIRFVKYCIRTYLIISNGGR